METLQAQMAGMPAPTRPPETAKPKGPHYLPLHTLRLVREGSVQSDVKRIRSPSDALVFLQPMMQDLPNETMVVVSLNGRNDVLSVHTVYSGNINTIGVRNAEIFRTAILVNAAAIIMAHNHPSGDPEPSPEDVRVTEEARAAGKLLEIALLDHLIIGCPRCMSMRERGLGFSSEMRWQ